MARTAFSGVPLNRRPPAWNLRAPTSEPYVHIPYLFAWSSAGTTGAKAHLLERRDCNVDQPPFPTEALRTRARYDHARRDHCTQPEREAPDDLASGDCARRVVYDTSSSVPPKASEHSAHSTVVLRHPIKNAYSKRPQDSSITSAAPLDLEVDVEREQDGHHDAAQQHAHALHREDLGPPLSVGFNWTSDHKLIQ